MNWSFKDLKYERVEINPIPQEIVELAKKIKNPADAKELAANYREFDKWMNHMETMAVLGDIRFTIDTGNEFYKAEREYYDMYLPSVSELAVSVGNSLLDSPYRSEVEELVGSVALRNMELERKSISPAIIADMQRENSLASEYQTLTASAKISFDGKELTLPQLEPYKLSTDREVRRAAVEAEGKYFASIAPQLDRVFDDLVKVRTGMAKKLGFETYTDMSYCMRKRNCFSKEDIAVFRDNVAKNVSPLVTKLLCRQYERTGIDDPKVWDRPLVFTDGNPKPHGTPEEIFANGKKMYHELSKETGEFMDFMLEHDLFDVLSKPGKANGGYCTGLADFKAPFVFANFNGTQGDIEVLTHECGHAFEGYTGARLYDIGAKREYTSEIAEIHSMGMEFFTYPWMKLFFEEDTDKFYYSHMFGDLKFWPYGCMIDHFQHSVYDNPEWTPAERNEEWSRIEKLYRPDIDNADVPHYANGGMWQYKLHVYLYPFYYIDYCLAQFGAASFWKLMRDDRELAWSKYYELVKAGGTKDYVTLLTEAGFESPFEADALKNIATAMYDYLCSLDVH
ncbi:MAG: M3 family oligoendopeptidase [Oscillospiraceae bacterium]